MFALLAAFAFAQEDQFLNETDPDVLAETDVDVDKQGWLEQNPWVFAVLFLVVGPVIAFRGLMWLQ